MGEIFRPACMAVTASAILPFLIFETVTSSHLNGLGEIMQDVLGLPKSILDHGTEDDEFYEALLPWVDPNVVDILGSPYENPLDEDGLRKLLN
ncbi:MAG: hypothetical protein ABI972_21790 [Acidobacteriota bacterium]